MTSLRLLLLMLMLLIGTAAAASAGGTHCAFTVRRETQGGEGEEQMSRVNRTVLDAAVYGDEGEKESGTEMIPRVRVRPSSWTEMNITTPSLFRSFLAPRSLPGLDPTRLGVDSTPLVRGTRVSARRTCLRLGCTRASALQQRAAQGTWPERAVARGDSARTTDGEHRQPGGGNFRVLGEKRG